MTVAKQLVLITGGAGFIGSHLSKLLLDNNFAVRILDPLTVQVHGAVPQGLDWLDSPDISFIRGSVCNKQELSQAMDGVDFIVHLAAETGTGQSMYEIDKYYQVNCQGTALLFDILANNQNHKVKRVVLASSRSIYGEGAYTCDHCKNGKRLTPNSRTAEALSSHRWEPDCPVCNNPLTVLATTETDAVKPASIYAASKYAQEDIVKVACQSLGIDYSILRLQNVYGEGQSLNNPYTGILSIFSTRVRRNLELPIFEDGNESRDFVHVSDVAGAMLKCLVEKNALNDIFNVGSGIASTVTEVAEHLSLALGSTPNIRVTAQYRIGDIRHNKADTERLVNILGYQPKVSLAEGMKKFASWVLQQPLPEDQLAKTYDELKSRNLMG